MYVCLIGYNLTNFIIASELEKKGFKIDILYESLGKKNKTNRTIGISKNNFKFINSHHKKIYKLSWLVENIKIFNQKNKLNESIDFSSDNKINFFLVKFSDLFNLYEKNCKKSKKIHFRLAKSIEI